MAEELKRYSGATMSQLMPNKDGWICEAAEAETIISSLRQRVAELEGEVAEKDAEIESNRIEIEQASKDYDSVAAGNQRLRAVIIRARSDLTTELEACLGRGGLSFIAVNNIVGMLKRALAGGEEGK